MNYRFGLEKEALQISYLILEASKLTRLLYTDLYPGKSALEALLQDVKRKSEKCSYLHCLLALKAEQIVGVANFYPSEGYLLTDEMKRRFSPEKVKYIAPIFASPLPHSLYIAALGIDQSKRGCGIGKSLLEKTNQMSKESNHSAISLHCWIDNTPAMEFYKKLSFSMIEQFDLGPHPLIPYAGRLALLYRSNARA